MQHQLEDAASCYPTATAVDIYYIGNDTSDLEQRLIDALNATDLEALFAGIGVLEVGPVVVTPDDGGTAIVRQQSAQGLAVGAIAAIAVAAIVMLLVLMYVGRADRLQQRR
jgi:hypothetical protein